MNNSLLFDEKTFYDAFLRDLERSEKEIIIENPFITSNRTKSFYPVFKRLLQKRVKIYIITRNIDDYESNELKLQAQSAIYNFEVLGINTLLCIGKHHRKLAILDRNILWEGSLNILSQSRSREIMRRIRGEDYAMEMFNFLKYEKYI